MNVQSCQNSGCPFKMAQDTEAGILQEESCPLISKYSFKNVNIVKGKMLSEVKRRGKALPGDERERPGRNGMNEWKWGAVLFRFSQLQLFNNTKQYLLRLEQVGLNCKNQREYGFFYKLRSACFKIIFNKTVKCFCCGNLLSLSKQQNNKAA